MKDAITLAADSARYLPRLLTAAEVAGQTGLSAARVYELVRAGQIPHVRLGRAVRFSARNQQRKMISHRSSPYKKLTAETQSAQRTLFFAQRSPWRAWRLGENKTRRSLAKAQSR